MNSYGWYSKLPVTCQIHRGFLTHRFFTNMGKQNSVTAFLKGLYQDDFKWALVKSIGFFALGIRIAQEFHGVELLTPQA